MKKKNLGLIITIIIVAVILVIAGALALMYFMTDLFKTNEQLFWKYAGESSKITKMVSNESQINQEQWKESNSYISEGNLKIAVTKETGTQEVNAKTTSKHNQSNGRTYSDITLLNGEEELLKFSYIHNQDIYALYCKDIFEPYYVGFKNSNLKEFGAKMGLPEEITTQIPDTISIDSIKTNVQISEEESKYLSDTYFEVIKNAIPEEKYQKIERTIITINNKNYNTNGYILTLSGEDIKQIVINILNKAKEDQKTIEILNRIISSETESINVQEMLEKLIEDVQNQNVEENNYTITVYPAGNGIEKIQLNCNNEVEVILDIDSSNKNKEVFALKIGDISSEQRVENDSSLQLTVEKQTLNNMITYTAKCINNATNYEITMNTSIGNIADDKIENNSRIIILDNDTKIETSYYKTMQATTEEVEIEELTDTSAVIVNNYPIEQLQAFFAGLETKATQVIQEKIGNLNISLANTQDSMYYFEGILSAIISISNVNAVPQPISIIGITAITTANQIMQGNQQIQNNVSSNTNQTMTEQAKKAFNSNYELYKGEQTGSNIKSLCNFTKTSNSLSPDTQQVIIQLGRVGEQVARVNNVDESSITQIENTISAEKKYNVTIGYDENGCVAVIGIEEIN